MKITYTIYLCIASALLSAALIRHYYSADQVKTVETTKEVEHNDIQTVTHTVTQPNGSVDTTTTTVDHSQKVDSSTSTASSVVKTSKINISALVANDFSKGVLIPVYGISASKEFIGPITIGAFGLTNGTLGLSVGINF